MHTEGTAVFGGSAWLHDERWSGTFTTPRAVLRADRLADIPAVLQAADDAARDGQWVALVVAYEAAPAFDTAFDVMTGSPEGVPLVWAAVYGDPPTGARPSGRPRATLPVPDWRPSLDASAFATRMHALQAHIAAGDSYQVNLTFPLRATCAADTAWAWYEAARERARVPYAAWIDLGTHVVMSLSPELFVERTGTRLVTRPMKGTHARGRWPDEDVEARRTLGASEKARAENVMIVDLLRNDLGRIAETGSVRVTDLCALEAYPTVWQMTSTIEARVSPDCSLGDVFGALFPCGSVTGAPKVRTMVLIAEHEVAPRGVYTGAIGLLRPGGDFVCSVPIRTVVLERATGIATLGVGAGIVADSIAADEYAECLLKARFAAGEGDIGSDGLFETLRLDAGAYWLRERHVTRLQASADRLGLPCDTARLEAALDETASTHAEGCWRVRLALDAEGMVTCGAEAYDAKEERWRVALARVPVSRHDLRLFHKSRNRTLYDAARASAPSGVDDVLLWNREGELTESCIANLVVEMDGARWTPPLDCGLLPGTFRAQLLEAGEIRERVLTRNDLRRATRVWLVNSLRGWIVAEVVEG